MKMFLTAVAVAIALPAVAHAQEAPEAKPTACCEKMKAEGKECCCKDMEQMDHSSHGGAAGADAHPEHSGAAGTSQPAHQHH